MQSPAAGCRPRLPAAGRGDRGTSSRSGAGTSAAPISGRKPDAARSASVQRRRGSRSRSASIVDSHAGAAPPIERPAAQAGAVAGGQRLACGCEELHAARRSGLRAGQEERQKMPECAPRPRTAVVAAAVGKRRERRGGIASAMGQAGDHRKMNTTAAPRTGRSAPRYAAWSGSVTLYRCGAPPRGRRWRRSVVPAADRVKTVVDPANAGRGGRFLPSPFVVPLIRSGRL